MQFPRIKKDDTVKVLSGKEKGKSGKILKVLPKDQAIVVEGLNIRVRFSRPKRKGEKGQRMEIPAPLNVSKVMLVCPHCGKPTRTASELNQQGRFRKCKNCNKIIA
jgi:large subunit ribosomal protein L24